VLGSTDIRGITITVAAEDIVFGDGFE